MKDAAIAKINDELNQLLSACQQSIAALKSGNGARLNMAIGCLAGEEHTIREVLCYLTLLRHCSQQVLPQIINQQTSETVPLTDSLADQIAEEE